MPSSSSRRPHSGSSTLASSGSSASAAPAYKVPKFLRSLYAILETEDPSVVRWVQNQALVPNRLTAFHILDMATFERHVLPKYFKHQKFASFQRQLNNFGFRKWTKTQSSGVCTFSHNCFPPDAQRAAVRDHWRMRSPLPNAPIDGSADGSTRPLNPPRRIVGNGITKADRKRQQQQQQRCQKPPKTTTVVDPAAPCTSLEVFNSPANASASAGASTSLARALRHKAASSHQPPAKTLARPSADPPSGLEAFCGSSSSSSSAFILPPLPPHHLLATPRTSAFLLSSPSAASDMESAPFGSFRHSLASAMGLKGLEDASAAPKAAFAPAADAAAMHGAFLEPWALDAHTAGLELSGGAFPMDVDWSSGLVTPRTAAMNAAVCHQQPPPAPHHAHSYSYGHIHHHHPLSHGGDRGGAPSGVEDFGLDNLLFVE